MAVFERTFRLYRGSITPPATRFLVFPHYIFKDLFQSKALVFFYALCCLYPLLLSLRIYISNNLGALKALFGAAPQGLVQVSPETFGYFLYVQGGLAFLLALAVGPGLISRDLANNGLPLYLSRPISQAEYVVGKMSVLFILLSGISWVPGLMLYGLQGSLAGGDWMVANLRVAMGLVVGSCVWILFLSLLALALSAWVKWKPVAAFLMCMIFGVGWFFAQLAHALFSRSWGDWGYYFDPGRLIVIVWSGLLDTTPPDGPSFLMASVALTVMAAFLVLILNRKLRAYEVVS